MNTLHAEIAGIMKTTPGQWIDLTGTLPAELLSRKPAPDQWSALECLQHLTDTETVFQFRIQCFLEGRDFPNFDPNTEGSSSSNLSAVELARKFAVLREQSLSILQKLSDTDLDRRAVHGEIGQVTLREMLNEWAGHDLTHLSQANRSLMQPFLRECGPWQRYYTKYVI